MLRPFQAFICSHNAHVVPHGLAKFSPVMGNYHFFVWVGDPAFVPIRQSHGFAVGLGQNVVGGSLPQYHALQQAVAGQAVGTVQAGVGGFAHGIQAGNVGAGIVVGDHATAGVMRSRHDWNALLGDVDAQFKATFVNGREMFFQFLCRLMADVQVHAIQAAFFHFKVDSARHYIPRCQFCPFVVLGHEACAIGQFQQTTFAAHCFGDQKAFGIGVVQAGGVELDEFHIGNSASRTPGHGNAVTRGCVGVGGVVVHFARAAASQHNVRAGQGEYALRLFVQNVSTQNAGLFLA
ncbi:conserved hypothetical protein [methanotrophic bacterial endosymbiont of Bathymodiolus sp.]|nr:conserved hypothetical protein [methanotrophic bacterial endosymbiont of Bathymodiolus sp.]